MRQSNRPRDVNQNMILSLVATEAPVTRAQLVHLSGLSRPTVLGIISDLEKNNLIVSSKVSAGTVGRSPDMFRPNPRISFVVGIDVGGSKMLAEVADLSGQALATLQQTTDPLGGEAVLEQVARIARQVVAAAELDWSEVAAVSIGIPGVLTTNGRLDLAGNIPGLDGLDVKRWISDELGHEVIIENDVNMAAVGEFAHGAGRGYGSMALLAIGTGLGLGIILDGDLVRGARGRAGEVAYLPIGGDPSTPEARHRGTLELALSGSGFRNLSSEVVESRRDVRRARQAGRGLEPEEIIGLAATGDEASLEVVSRYATIAAQGVLSVASILDPDVVVLGGGLGCNTFLLGPIRDALYAIAPFPITVDVSRFGNRAGVVGAVTDARRRVLEQIFASNGPLSGHKLESIYSDLSVDNQRLEALGK